MAEYIEREAVYDIFSAKQQELLKFYRYYQLNDEAKEEFNRYESYLKEIEAISTADVVDCPKWISIKEKLPEENVRVLVWLKENDSYTRIDTDRLAHSNVTFWVRWGKLVTHWCPIPESLKEGAEE